MNGSVAVATGHRAGRGAAVMLSLAALAALFFVGVAALPYFMRVEESQFNQYWPMRGWLLAHISMGMVALLTGPVQLWLGLSDRALGLHKPIGFAYMGAVVISSAAAYYLAFNTSGGPVFGSGLVALATAWLITTGLAFLAIKRHLYEQHREWMIRSYVVTFAFVIFRALDTVLAGQTSLSVLDRIGIAAWVSWAVPLVATEAILQGRKILRVRPD